MWLHKVHRSPTEKHTNGHSIQWLQNHAEVVGSADLMEKHTNGDSLRRRTGYLGLWVYGRDALRSLSAVSQA